MWEGYKNIIQRYKNIPLSEERRLLARAKRGSKKSADEIVLRHIGFVIYRLHKRGFRDYVLRFGEDLVSESIPLLYRKIKTYDLNYRYCDSEGTLRPVKFSSYIWKRIDGFIIDSLKKEARRERQEVSGLVDSN